MAEGILTREFSICLLPTDDVVRDIAALRRELPVSPYRDDMPHITLLRGITSGVELSDEKLAQTVGALITPAKHLPFSAIVGEIANRDNQLYSSSGIIVLDASEDLLSFRRQVAATLLKNGYSVEPEELKTYTPHITIRLGVPLEGDQLNRTQKLFSNRTVRFSEWRLFRLVIIGDKRTMQVVNPIPLV